MTVICFGELGPLPSARQHPGYGDCLEVQMVYYQNCSVLGCVTQCSESSGGEGGWVQITCGQNVGRRLRRYCQELCMWMSK